MEKSSRIRNSIGQYRSTNQIELTRKTTSIVLQRASAEKDRRENDVELRENDKSVIFEQDYLKIDRCERRVNVKEIFVLETSRKRIQRERNDLERRRETSTRLE